MTFILGAHLSDRIYLAADSRVSLGSAHFDDAIKVSPISEAQPDGAWSVAAAGNLNLSAYLFNAVRDAVRSHQLSRDIRYLPEELPDFLKASARKYAETAKDLPLDDISSCLLIGGTCLHRKKQLSEEKLGQLADTKRSVTAVTLDTERRIAHSRNQDPTFDAICEKIQRQTGKTIRRLLDEGSRVDMGEYLQQFPFGFPPADSLLIGCKVKLGYRDAGVSASIETAEWGERLAYGTGGLTKDAIKPDLLAVMEFARRPQNKPHMMECAFLNTEMMEVARRDTSGKIGGPVVIAIVQHHLLQVTHGPGIVLNAGRYYGTNPSGLSYPMQPFFNWQTATGSSPANASI